MAQLTSYDECKQKIKENMEVLRARLFAVMSDESLDLQSLAYECGVCWSTAYNFLVHSKDIKNCTARKFESFLAKYEMHGDA